MRKIRDFKLHLHFKELRRRARRSLDLAAAGAGDDASFQKVLDEVSSACRAAVVFESFGPDSEETARLAPVPGLAHTVGLSTLGPQVGALVARAREEGEQRGRLYELVAGYALEETVRFVIDLLKDEVEAEQCELSPIHHLREPEALACVLGRLPSEKIGVSLREGCLEPERSAAFCLSWLMRGRAAGAKGQAAGPARSAGRKK